MSPSVIGESAPIETAKRVTFRVHAIPATQGSARAFMPPGSKHPVVTHDNPGKLRSWRDAVASEALRARGPRRLLVGPVAVSLRFLMPKPRTRPAVLKTDKQILQWARPWRKPDLDKLQRSAIDALTGILLIDDGQIVKLFAEKKYGDSPGVEVVVETLTRED